MTFLHLYTFILLYKYQSNVILEGLVIDLDIEILENNSEKTDYINGYYN